MIMVVFIFIICCNVFNDSILVKIEKLIIRAFRFMNQTFFFLQILPISQIISVIDFILLKII